MKKVGDFLETILKNINNGDAYLFFLIMQKFQEFFPNEAFFARPYSLKKGILLIQVDHSSGLAIIQLKKLEILSRLKKEFSEGQLREIKFFLKKG